MYIMFSQPGRFLLLAFNFPSTDTLFSRSFAGYNLSLLKIEQRRTASSNAKQLDAAAKKRTDEFTRYLNEPILRLPVVGPWLCNEQ